MSAKTICACAAIGLAITSTMVGSPLLLPVAVICAAVAALL